MAAFLWRMSRSGYWLHGILERRQILFISELVGCVALLVRVARNFSFFYSV
jgi:hypothetical protein